tara:strand:+ start:168 stop:1211 length:1044 start_codon:yes stop_codon:yes gene_type:complete
MARTIPSGSSILTLVPGVKTKELGSRRKSDGAEYYTIDDLIFTAVGEGGGAGTLALPIVVTNPDTQAFGHLDSVFNSIPGRTEIPAGTSIELVLREILNPYIATGITLNSVSAAIKSEGVWGGYNPIASSTDTVLEAGQGFRIQSFSYSVDDSDVIVDNSINFLNTQGSILFGGFSDTATTGVLGTIHTVENTEVSSANGETFNYRLSAREDGGVNEIDIYSGRKYFKFNNRARAGGSEEASVNTNNAADLFADLVSYNALSAKTNIAFVGDADTDDGDKYVWIVYPSVWGEASDILLGDFGVKDDFLDSQSFSVQNIHGVSVLYRFYRSRSAGPFGVGQNITLTFS